MTKELESKAMIFMVNELKDCSLFIIFLRFNFIKLLCFVVALVTAFWFPDISLVLLYCFGSSFFIYALTVFTYQKK